MADAARCARRGRTRRAQSRDRQTDRRGLLLAYSANNDAKELRKLAFEANLEGVYCASRVELVDEVLGVFDSLVKKVLDLDHTRGIVMGATSKRIDVAMR